MSVLITISHEGRNKVFVYFFIFIIIIVLQLAQEAYACEEKEEKLVNDAVKHLTQANYQIKDLHDQFSVKVTSLVLTVQ